MEKTYLEIKVTASGFRIYHGQSNDTSARLIKQKSRGYIPPATCSLARVPAAFLLTAYASFSSRPLVLLERNYVAFHPSQGAVDDVERRREGMARGL